jgi:hypothetical protein
LVIMGDETSEVLIDEDESNENREFEVPFVFKLIPIDKLFNISFSHSKINRGCEKVNETKCYYQTLMLSLLRK